MKRLFYILLLGVLMSVSYFSGNTEKGVYDEINKAICQGKAGNLAEYFAPEMELNLNNSQNRCTKSQAAQVLEEFFRQNKPSEYKPQTDRNFISGVMRTSSGKSYKVDYTLKTVNNHAVITGLYVY